jgi:hypothetical protein
MCKSLKKYKNTLFSCLTNRKFLFWTKEGEKSEIGAPVLEYLKDL